jgi:putative membrane protein
MEHYSKADKFFNEEEKKRIEETIHDIESRTIGEVAVMVVDSSDQYIEAEVMGGVLMGSLLSLIVTISYLHSSIWSYIPLSFLFFFPCRFIFKKVPILKTTFIGIKRKEDTVRLRAVRAFYEKGLYKTKKNTGVLFFLSLLEKKVWVLADKGIYEKNEQETLNKFARIVSQGIKDGRACDALCESMKEARELLSRCFPITPGDIDELPDEVMTDDSK